MTIHHIGIDFSQDYFDLLITDPHGHPITPVKRFSHDLPGSQQARSFILDTCQAHPVDQLWIGGEATGMLWWHLFQRWAVDEQLAAWQPSFFLLNPRPVKAFRKTAPLRDKTDRKDARLIARYLGIPDAELQPWYPDAEYWSLRLLTRYRFRLAQLLGTLKRQALTLLYVRVSAYQQVEPFSDAFGRTSQSVLEQFPDLQAVLELSVEELARQLTELGKARFPDPQANAQRLQQAVRQSYPVLPAQIPLLHFLMQRALAMINCTQRQLDLLDAYIAQLVQSDSEIANLQTIGGIGPVYAAGLAAELRPTQRFFQTATYQPTTGRFAPRSLAHAHAAVGKLAGLWWPRRDSGQFQAEDRHLPRACNPYLRYYLFEAANHVRGHVVEYQQFYQRKYRQATKHHHRRALILTARKLARLVFALLAKHQSYQPRRSSD